MYLGPVVLFKILKKETYEHFLVLHCAISFLISSKCATYSRYAKQLLKLFVSDCSRIYGKQYLIYNVHSLIHIADDVERYGALDNFSAFKFENYLGYLKKKVRSPYKPLQQVGNRISETDFKPSKMCNGINYSHEHFQGPIPPCYRGKQYSKLDFGTYLLQLKSSADCYCMLRNKTVMQISNIIVLHGNTPALFGSMFSHHEKFYDYPCDSTNLDIFLATEMSSQLTIIDVQDVLCKCFVIPIFDKFAIFPLLHCV